MRLAGVDALRVRVLVVFIVNVDMVMVERLVHVTVFVSFA